MNTPERMLSPPEPVEPPSFDAMTPSERARFVMTLTNAELRELCCELGDDCDALMATLRRADCAR